MIEKPDPNHLCDDFGTSYNYYDEMCRGCDNFVFCMELHDKILSYCEWLKQREAELKYIDEYPHGGMIPKYNQIAPSNQNL